MPEFYDRELSEVIFQDEQQKISQLLTQGKVILVAAQIQQVPENYRVVLEAKTAKDIPHVERIRYVASSQASCFHQLSSYTSQVIL